MTALAVLPLLDALREIAADRELLHLHDPLVTSRQRTELISTPALQAWLITWPPGSSSGWHDHGVASGAFTTIAGRLTEYSWNAGRYVRSIGTRDSWAFSSRHIHDVRNNGLVAATSVHAYSPVLASITRYEFDGDRLRAVVDGAAA